MHSYLPVGVLDEFVEAHLRSGVVLEPGGSVPQDRAELVPHRNAKVVYEYHYLGHRIIAKVYDNARDGASAYEGWRALWMQGFGPSSRHRVPEPLAYLPEHRTLLMEPVAGTCLLPLVLRDPVACREGMRHASQWLAELHTAPECVGSPDNSSRILYRLARKLVRAIAHRPELERTMALLISELGRRGDAFLSSGTLPAVQTHGRYHCGHVFVTAGTVSVIDLDRAAPSDPSKDVAEFLCRFRIEARKEAVKRRLTDDLGAVGTQVFIDEYERISPLRRSGLVYYWSATLIGLMLEDVVKRHLDEDVRSARIAYYESEFASLPEIVTDLVQPA